MSRFLAASIIYTLHRLTTVVAVTLSMGQNCFSPPNYEALVDKLWPAAPGVSKLQGTNNELNVTYSAAALASLQIGASQTR